MTERLANNRTIVGVPFYDGEGREVLDSCLENIDACLNNLGMDAKIVVGINGPRVSHGQIPLSCEINRSRYNAEVSFVKTPPGLVNAEKVIGRKALEEGCGRIFLTDADISRFPHSLVHMWGKGDAPIVGANHSVYPIEILIGAGINLTPQEIAFIRIFEADKHPLLREFTLPHRPHRLKGSLLLVDTNLIKTMFDQQGITSDSRMNRTISQSDRQLVPEAAFMHFARVGITDHMQARLRHFRAAAVVGDLENFSRQSLIYRPDMVNAIVAKILAKHGGTVEVVSDFLLQCALRYQVVEICKTIASGKEYKPTFSEVPFEDIDMSPVDSFRTASERIELYLGQVDWSVLDSSVTSGNGITNKNQTRVPLDMLPLLKSEPHKQIILRHLGLSNDMEI